MDSFARDLGIPFSAVGSIIRIVTTDPGDDIPEDIASSLRECSEEELRAVTREAQRLLAERIGLTAEIKPRPEGEEIISTEETEAYTLVVVQVDWSDEPQVYYVRTEPDPESGEEEYRWQYIGPVES